MFIFHSRSLKCSQKVELVLILVQVFLAELLEGGQHDTAIVEKIVLFYRKWNCQFRTQEKYLIRRVSIYTI